MELFSVHKQRKFADIVMLKFVGVGVHRAYKIGILNHGEEETLGDGAQDGVVDRQGFDPAENVNVLSSTLVML